MEQWWWSGGAKDGDLENGAPQPFFRCRTLSTHELATRPTRPYHATWRVCVCAV